jgi:hypothetical protein
MALSASEAEIQALVDRETEAWNRQDSESLVSIFHPDMVWLWPPDAAAHDPLLWVFPFGRFNRERWKAGWDPPARPRDDAHLAR